jgi:hypothetical protein
MTRYSTLWVGYAVLAGAIVTVCSANVGAQGTIDGVWTGGYRCGTEAPRRLTLTIREAGGTLTGEISAETAPKSDQRFTYKLGGSFTAATGRFTLKPDAGQPPAPGNAITQIDGSFDARTEQLEANVTPGCGLVGTFKEPLSAASTSGTPTTPPPSPAATRVRRAPVAPAVPIVTKPARYWAAYKTKTIQEIFDGTFGPDAQESGEFLYLYTGYILRFSKTCRDYLPADHLVYTVTQISPYGAKTLLLEAHLDRTLAPKFQEYQNFRITLDREAARAILPPSAPILRGLIGMDDIDTFIDKEGCAGPAVPQLRVNLVRAAEQRPSIQQDASGAPLEMPTFMGACSAFYDVPVSSKYSMRNAQQWCDCLHEEYKDLMTPTEKTFYADDFLGRFVNQIAQTREVATDARWSRPATDAQWLRLHPTVERCRQ